MVLQMGTFGAFLVGGCTELPLDVRLEKSKGPAAAFFDFSASDLRIEAPTSNHVGTIGGIAIFKISRASTPI